MKAKKFAQSMIAVVLLCSLILAGCQTTTPTPAAQEAQPASPAESSQPTAAAPVQSPAEITELSVVSWWDFTTTDALQQLKAKFEEKNPDIVLNFVQVPPKDYADKVLTMIAGGGDVPDVMMLAMDKLPMFADRGALTSLDEFITEDYKNDLYPVAFNALTYQGSVYAVPRTVTSQVMYLNKKMFDEAGVAYPGEDWTWDDFLKIAQDLTKVDANGQPLQWGFYFPKWNDGFYHFLRQNDGGLVSADGTKSMLSDPNSLEALHFLQDMIIKHKVVPTESQAKQFGTDDTAVFIANKVGMLIGGLSWTTAFDNAGVEYVIVPLPKGKRAMNTSFVNAWTLPSGAKHPELSWRVLEFFGGQEGQQIVLDTNLGLPASKSVDTSAILAKRPDNKYFIEAMEYAEPFPTPLYGVDFFKAVEQEFDLMWLGERTVEDAVAAVEQVGNDILAGKQP